MSANELDSLKKLIENQKLLIESQQVNINLLTAVINSLPGSVYWKDKDGHYIGRNQYAKEKMKEDGFIWQECEGLTDYDLFNKEIADRFRRNDLDVMNNEKEMQIEEPVIAGPSQNFINYSIKKPLYIDNKVAGVIGTSIDISNLKKIELELNKAKQKAESLNLAKEIFMQNLEHDMRTPITNIIMLCHQLLKQSTQSHHKDSIKTILNCSEMILKYFSELLEYSDIQEDNFLKPAKSFSIKKCLKNAISTHSININNSSLTIKHHISNDVPEYITSDELAFFRIISNLVSNAIKFTPKGTIDVSLYTKDFNYTKHIILTVTDSGIGIKKDEQTNIFNSFYRITPANQEIYQGKGLGLNIVKRLVEALNGSVLLKSEPNKGSTFTCRIPYQTTQVINPPVNLFSRELKQQLSHFENILLVEDNLICQTITKDLLNSVNLTVSTVDNGFQAIQLSHKIKFDLILMDIGLPDMTGFNSSINITNDSNLNHNTPIILLTAHSERQFTKEKDKHNSIKYIITKPFTLDKLSKALDQLDKCLST